MPNYSDYSFILTADGKFVRLHLSDEGKALAEKFGTCAEDGLVMSVKELKDNLASEIADLKDDGQDPQKDPDIRLKQAAIREAPEAFSELHA